MTINISNGLIIDIRLNNGLYAFDSESGTGKSYLCSVLDGLIELGDNSISVITYNRDLDYSGLVKNLRMIKKNLIVFDRLDLYLNDDIENFIMDNYRNCIILCDLKLWSRFKKVCPKLVDIEFNTGGFLVYDSNDI